MSNNLQNTSSAGVSRGGVSPLSVLNSLRTTKMFDQLCLLVLDGSNSMHRKLDDQHTKAEATASAAKALIQTLQKSSRATGFSAGIICFSDKPEVRLYAQPITSIQLDKINFSPLTGSGEATFLSLALTECERISEAFMNNSSIASTLKRTVRIIVLTDGYASDPDQTREITNDIKTKWGDRVRIISAILSNENENFEKAEGFLQEISSKDKNGRPYFSKAHSGAELRSYFESSSTDE